MSYLGPTKQREDGGIIYAENDAVRVAYVKTDDPAEIGKMDWHRGVMVEFIANAQTASKSEI